MLDGRKQLDLLESRLCSWLSRSASTYSCLVLRSSSLFFWNMSRQCPVSSALSSSSRCRFLTTELIFCFSDSRLA